jgi:hypothetical protein
MSWKDEAIDLLIKGNSKVQISKILSKKYTELADLDSRTCKDKMRHFLNSRYAKRILCEKGYIVPKSAQINKEKVTYSNGITTFEIEKEKLKGEEITPESIMKAKGLNPIEWEVVSYTSNIWQQQTKEGKTIDLYQSKLSVKPIKNKNVILGITHILRKILLFRLQNLTI